MADFEVAILKTLAHEGGAKLTDDPSDRGGVTKFGISQRAYPHVDIRNLTEALARDIYKRDFWNRIRGDDIRSQLVAENIFDTGVNMGVRTGSRLAQLALGIAPADGVIGNHTLEKLNAVEESTFLANYTLVKVARYAHLCNRDRSQQRFLLGWINRALGGAA